MENCKMISPALNRCSTFTSIAGDSLYTLFRYFSFPQQKILPGLTKFFNDKKQELCIAIFEETAVKFSITVHWKCSLSFMENIFNNEIHTCLRLLTNTIDLQALSTLP